METTIGRGNDVGSGTDRSTPGTHGGTQATPGKGLGGLAFVTGTFTGIAWAIYVATVNPTVGAAVVAAITTILQTSIVLWHDRRMDRRVSARRLVAVKGTPDNPEAVIVTNEERRSLEDPQAVERLQEEPRNDNPDTDAPPGIRHGKPRG